MILPVLVGFGAKRVVIELLYRIGQSAELANIALALLLTPIGQYWAH
jgi:hypothetical protein